ncbi:hypothetical protein ACSZOC_19705, partial [Aeromonas hydrophila]
MPSKGCWPSQSRPARLAPSSSPSSPSSRRADQRLWGSPQATPIPQQLLAVEGVLAEPEPTGPVGPEQLAL